MTAARSILHALAGALICAGMLAAGARAREDDPFGLEPDTIPDEAVSDVADDTPLADDQVDADDPAELTDLLDTPSDMDLDLGESHYRAIFRPVLWIAWTEFEFGKAPGTTEISLEGDYNIGSAGVQIPMELLTSTENQEYRFRYLFWNREGSTRATSTEPISFGDTTYISGNVDATLSTNVIGFDFVQRIAGTDTSGFEFYLMAGADIFISKLELDGDAGSEKIDTTIPILTVGMGLRFQIKEDVSFYASSSALSYAQLLGIEDAYFDVRDTYRSVDIAVRWDVSPRWSWGAGWKHYTVGFEHQDYPAEDVMVYQKLHGPCAWLNIRF